MNMTMFWNRMLFRVIFNREISEDVGARSHPQIVSTSSNQCYFASQLLDLLFFPKTTHANGFAQMKSENSKGQVKR